MTDINSQLADHARAINFIWTLVAGFLVMFMQAGFALIETGMCRAKNAAHTMSMNLLVYCLSMMGFFVCGFALMMGGVNGSPAGSGAPLIGGPKSLGLYGGATLNHMIYLPIAGKSWGLIGASGFFLSGHSITPASLFLFFYMMVFIDTTAGCGAAAGLLSWASTPASVTAPSITRAPPSFISRADRLPSS
jgi:ammonium transporter, Amt family